MKISDIGDNLVSATAFSLVGVIVFGIAFFVIDKLTPFSIRKEI